MDGTLARAFLAPGRKCARTSTFIHVLCPAVVIYGGAESHRTCTPAKIITPLLYVEMML